MKKIVIAVISVLVFGFILIIIYTNLSALKYNNNKKQIEEYFVSENKKVDNVNVETYYGDETYYIISYTKENKSYISVLDSKKNNKLDVEEDSLYELKKDYKIGYKNNKLIYEVKTSSKDGFVYSYYDAMTGEFIKNIRLDK